MMDAETRDWQPTRERTTWLTVSLALVLLPHVTRIPVWVSIGFVVLAYWRIEHVYRGVRLPGRWTRVLLSLVIVTGVFMSYGTLFGRSAGIAALAVLAGMKLLETDTLRDAHAAVFLGFFLVITNFLYSQSIPTGLYMLLVVAVIAGTLVSINTRDEGVKAQARLRYIGGMLVQAAPLALFLFVLFPRIPGPLWGLPKDAHSAVSGLSDSMSPGTISQLTQSSEVTFRVEFEGPIPASADLYWRGPVFTHTDGRTWSGGEPRIALHPPEIRTVGQPLVYALTLEPHSQHWVFALDVPAAVQREIRMTEDYQLLSTRRVRERRRFELRSLPNAIMTSMSPNQRRAALALPDGAHPKTRALAAQWRESIRDDAKLVATALDYFRNQPFYYTLKPPLLAADPVDDFLFESRRGFCEHYASAFTVLMRSAGIPTRIVTGYQGGNVNPLGGYVIVRQRDAHAWAEVWLGERGWVRIDPTAAVSPQRIELGMDATLPDPMGPAALGIEADGNIANLVRRLRHGWDSVNNSWNQWVLGYGAIRQQELLSRFGLNAGDWRSLLLALLVALGVALIVVAFWLDRRAKSSDRVTRAYARLCAKLARVGFERSEQEGPVAFSQRVARECPPLADAVTALFDRYVALRYADLSDDVAEFEKAVGSFRAHLR